MNYLFACLLRQDLKSWFIDSNCFYMKLFVPRPEIRSLESGSGEKDLISVHYQARVSVADESSSNLVTGIYYFST